jgi:hypothetical protein
VTKDAIDEFVADELSTNNIDLTKGTTWVVLLRRLRRLQKNGRDFCHNKMVNNNHARPGRRGARILQDLVLNDGIYHRPRDRAHSPSEKVAALQHANEKR